MNSYSVKYLCRRDVFRLLRCETLQNRRFPGIVQAKEQTNHFELLVFVSSQSLRPSELRVQADKICQGLAFIEMKKDTNTYKTWKSLCRKSESEKEYLSSKMLRCELSNLLSKLLADMLYLQHYHDKTMEGIEIRNISSENTITLEIEIRGLVLIVDLTTAVDCEGLWPVEDATHVANTLQARTLSESQSTAGFNWFPNQPRWNIIGKFGFAKQ